MSDIGSTLREARMHARIDISDVEAATKIRAKYLRALENEEWGLLPGPTFVRTFLRTYAEHLNLNARGLVDQYKSEHESVEHHEPSHFTPRLGDDRARRRRPPMPRRSRRTAALGVGGVLVAGLFVLGSLGDDGRRPAGERAPASTPVAPSAPVAPAREPAAQVALQVVPSAPVYVCLRDARDRRLIGGRNLEPTARRRTYRSRRFRILLGSGDVSLRIDGRTKTIPEVSAGVAYEITAKRTRRLPREDWPRC